MHSNEARANLSFRHFCGAIVQNNRPESCHPRFRASPMFINMSEEVEGFYDSRAAFSCLGWPFLARALFFVICW